MIYWFSFDLKNKIQEKIENRKRLIIIYIFIIIFLVNFLFNGSYATIIIMVEYDDLDVVLSKIVVQSVIKRMRISNLLKCPILISPNYLRK